MHDDGVNGDAQAGDNIFTLRFTANEAATGEFRLRVSAAFKGVVRRVLSGVTTAPIQPDPRTIDDDGDGYTENQGDCNDINSSIHPGAQDIPGNGVDEDCNGTDAIPPSSQALPP